MASLNMKAILERKVFSLFLAANHVNEIGNIPLQGWALSEEIIIFSRQVRKAVDCLKKTYSWYGELFCFFTVVLKVQSIFSFVVAKVQAIAVIPMGMAYVCFLWKAW